jgi:arylsulfatase A-like enzyme
VRTVHTPNAAKFASQGVVMEQCFCTAPQCSPSRAGLFTGMFPHCTGVLGLTHDDFLWDMRRDVTHAAARFKALGYDTMLMGHPHELRDRENRGWDSMTMETNGLRSAAAFDAYLTSRGRSDRPFFAQICMKQTHRPFPTPDVPADNSLGVTVPPYLDDTPGTRRDFAALQGSVRQWDEAIGRILDLLDARGLTDNTLVVITTDHGVAMPRAKCTLYDPGIEVLLMLRWPGHLAPGTRHDAMLSNIDVLPTLLEACGSQAPPEIQGRSFWPLLTGAVYQPNEYVFAEQTFHTYYSPMRGVRTRRFKYIRNFENGRTVVPSDIQEGEAFRDNIRRTFTPPQHPFEEFYDLQADPLERSPLPPDVLPEQRAELAAALAGWMVRTRDPLLEGPVSGPFYRRAIAEVLKQARR